ncbi:MAG: hypothetical protein AAF899_15130, partial [Pseudomonadota bacterium]
MIIALLAFSALVPDAGAQDGAAPTAAQAPMGTRSVRAADGTTVQRILPASRARRGVAVGDGAVSRAITGTGTPVGTEAGGAAPRATGAETASADPLVDLLRDREVRNRLIRALQTLNTAEGATEVEPEAAEAADARPSDDAPTTQPEGAAGD